MSTKFTIPEKRLWFGRANLFEDRVELTGWTWEGRYRREILLQDVRKSEWWTNRKGINFALHLEDGSSVALKLKRAAGTWKFTVDAMCGSPSLDEAVLPDEIPQKDAAA